MSNVRNDSIDRIDTLTEDQRKCIDGVLDFIDRPFDKKRFICGIIGPGGVGKTYVTQYIINNSTMTPSLISATSPTHKACRVFCNAIQGKPVNTIQSTFGFKMNMKLENFDPNRPQFNPQGRVKLDNTKLLMIDESSMIPVMMVNYIIKVCLALEIKIIFIGDSYQLTPVKESRSTAFDRCQVTYKLTTIVRQGDNNSISEILPLIRADIDRKTHKFFEFVNRNMNVTKFNDEGKGFRIVGGTQFTEDIYASFSDEAYRKNIDMCRVIGYTNNCVIGWNSYIRNTIVKGADKSIINKNDLIMSHETIVNEFMETIITNSEEYVVHDIVNFVDGTYGLKGYLVRFQIVNGGFITKPLFVVDHKDKFSVMTYHNTMTELKRQGKPGGNRTGSWAPYHEFKKSYLLAANIVNRAGEVLHERHIDYGFATTAHKSQGSTYDNVFVDLNDLMYDRNGNPYTNYDDMLRRIYVACSRAKDKLIIRYGS